MAGLGNAGKSMNKCAIVIIHYVDHSRIHRSITGVFCTEPPTRESFSTVPTVSLFDKELIFPFIHSLFFYLNQVLQGCLHFQSEQYDFIITGLPNVQ